MCRSNGWHSEQQSWFLAILPAVLNDFGRSFGMNTAFWAAFKDDNCSSWKKPFKTWTKRSKGNMWWPFWPITYLRNPWTQLGCQSIPANIEPMLIKCWANVADDGSTLVQLWVNVMCLLGYVTTVLPILDLCSPTPFVIVWVWETMTSISSQTKKWPH